MTKGRIYLLMFLLVSILDGATIINGGKLSTTPLNVKNNNPCNIKHTTYNKWEGSIRTKGSFEVFDTPLAGLRACAVVSIKNAKVTDSVEGFVKRFASEKHETMRDKHLKAYTKELQDTLGYTGRIQLDDLEKVIRVVVQMEGGDEATEHYKDYIGI